MEKSEDCDDDGVRIDFEDTRAGDDCGLENKVCEVRGAGLALGNWDLYAPKSYAGGR
jgi:hypothetical protein